ncbi:MAG TPA: Crp/Fnr family transcriptional regulator [Candidatus Binatia bacterium]|nr:Crp/Fnr family transcriptional regulator [Candidatus Binatia bacterium]
MGKRRSFPYRIKLGVTEIIWQEEIAIGKKPKKETGAFPLRPGSRSDATGKAIANVILLSIPDDEYDLLRLQLESVDLPQHQILHEPGQKIDYCYFLNHGMCSLVALSRDGRSVEVGIVGKEGMVGMSLMVGLRQEAFRAIMQMSGAGARIRSEAFEEILPKAPVMRQQLSRFALMHSVQVAQLAACNRLHENAQRLVRWLLMCQDRMDSAFLPLTHEFIAQMLGTGRPSVSLAAAALENAGLIENERGKVTIVNRKSLEEMACECYGIIQNLNGSLGLK